MDAGASFCRLMLGDTAAAGAAGHSAEPGVDPVDTVAGAWLACGPELERRRSSFGWEEPDAGAELGPVAARLVALAEPERAAVAAQAVGLAPAELESALGLEPGEGAARLARGHATLAGLGRPADRACATERGALAADGARGGRASTSHCADCRAFAAALSEQRPALRRAATRASAPPSDTRGKGLRSVVASGGGVVRVASRALEPRGRPARVVVALTVTLLAGGSGFGLVRALDDSDRDSGPRVVTATPVEPLPPDVNGPP